MTNKGRSVREQLDAGQGDADRLGVRLVEDFIDDDRSASTYRAREREEFERMIEWIEEKKLDIVFAWAATRLQRDITVYARLRDACAANGVLWCYGGKVYDLSNKDDRFRTGLDALLGEREVDEMRDNVLRSLRANAANGLPHGQRAYGYRRVYDPHTRKLVRTEKDPQEAKIVLEICKEVAAGKAYAQIAKSLNRRGVTPPAREWRKEHIRRLAEWREDHPWNAGLHPDWVQRIKDHANLRAEAAQRLSTGEDALDIARDFNERQEPLLLARWHPGTINDYARDPRYTGTRTHHGQVTSEDAWPAIVSKATHVQCVAIITERKGKSHNSRPGRAVNWLSGTLLCDVCSTRMGAGRNKYGPYYRCLQPPVEGLHGGKGYHVSAKTHQIDAFVEAKLFAWLSSPAFVAAFNHDDDATMRQIEEAEAQVQLLRDRLQSFQEQAIVGTLSAESLAAVEAGLLPKIQEADRKARSLKTPPIVRELIGATPEEVAEAWKGIAIAQRRLVAEALLDVRLKKGTRGGTVPIEERLLVQPRRQAQRSLAEAI
ncbi:recombinase family protein [Streptomyces buecherae]|uniref:Recombinase family protein n=1 Tax=Streptomyces buecherae TaxID=2763006 RepID=A0A7H8NBH3_9ACTN|nr:recombinase family protein [Streptomyces buecherae]